MRLLQQKCFPQELQASMVELPPGEGQPESNLLLHLRLLREALHCIREPRPEVLLPRVLHHRPVQGR